MTGESTRKTRNYEWQLKRANKQLLRRCASHAIHLLRQSFVNTMFLHLLQGIPVENNGRSDSRLPAPPTSVRRGGQPTSSAASSSAGGARTDTLLDLSEAFPVNSPPTYAAAWNAPAVSGKGFSSAAAYDPFVVAPATDLANNPFAADAAAAAAASGGRWETFGAGAATGTSSGAAAASATALASDESGGSFDILSYRNPDRQPSMRTSILRNSGAGAAGGAALGEWGGASAAFDAPKSTVPKDPFAMDALGLQLAQPSGAFGEAPSAGRAQRGSLSGSLSRGKSGSVPNLSAGGAFDIFESNADSFIGADPFADSAAAGSDKASKKAGTQFLNDDASRLVNLDNIVSRAPAGTFRFSFLSSSLLLY